jgi:hypothetical protein
MDNVFVKPARAADGKVMVVPDPHSFRPLAADGEWKPRTNYWVRRLRDHDVTEATPPPEASKAKAPPTAEDESPPAAAEPGAPAEARSRRK